MSRKKLTWLFVKYFFYSAEGVWQAMGLRSDGYTFYANAASKNTAREILDWYIKSPTPKFKPLDPAVLKGNFSSVDGKVEIG